MLSKHYTHTPLLLMHLTQPECKPVLGAGDGRTMEWAGLLLSPHLDFHLKAEHLSPYAAISSSRSWNTKSSASDIIMKSKPRHNGNRELKIKCLPTKNN